jgi:hypothetical protein
VIGTKTERVTKLQQQAAAREGSRWLARRAARRLAAEASPASVAALADAAVSSSDNAIVAIAQRAFAKTNDQRVIDAVCGVWRHARNRKLAALIADRGWIAAHPPELRVLTALLNGHVELLADAGPALARALVAVADDDDPPWRDQACEALTTLGRQDAREAVCGLAIEGGSPSALQAAMEAGFIPAEPHRYAVLLLLAREFNRYADLDFDGSLLAAVYAAADEDLRVRLSVCVRESGRVDWVRAVAGGKRLEALSDFDWELLIHTLHAAERWDQLWGLMLKAPPVWGIRIVIQLAGSGWVPNDPGRRRIYDGVLPSARAYEAAAFRGPGDFWQPSSIGELLNPLPRSIPSRSKPFANRVPTEPNARSPSSPSPWRDGTEHTTSCLTTPRRARLLQGTSKSIRVNERMTDDRKDRTPTLISRLSLTCLACSLHAHRSILAWALLPKDPRHQRTRRAKDSRHGTERRPAARPRNAATGRSANDLRGYL